MSAADCVASEYRAVNSGRREARRDCGRFTWMALVVGVCMNMACLFPETVNEPLLTHEPNRGYRFENIDKGPNNTDETFVCLTLSGGGTRAAALAFGVMDGLRGLSAPDGNGDATMLDEVDLISSASGGTFAALGYAAWRDEFFDGKFRKRFLDLNLHVELLRVMLNPINVIRLPSVVFDRIDVAANYYDRRVFGGYLYRDLITQNQRPFVVVNSTNLATATRVEFTQADFDLLGSDLGSVPIGYAAAASSAFPVVFSPLRMRYHAAPHEMRVLHDHVVAAKEAEYKSRLQKWAQHIATPRPTGPDGTYELDERHHRFMFLADGGLVDNLGLTHVIEALQEGEIRRLIEAGKIKRLIVITVDAGVKSDAGIEQWPSAPGIFMQTYKAATIGVDNYSDSLVRIMDFLMEDLPKREAKVVESMREICPEGVQRYEQSNGDLKRTFIHLGFHQIEDRERRKRFQEIPTQLFLPERDVDDLIELGRELVEKALREHGVACAGQSVPPGREGSK